MNFSTKTKGRAWISTIQISNMQKAGLTEEQYMDYTYVADYFISRWENSGNERTAAIAVCESESGCYHCHMALYGNLTTLKKVSDILFGSHVEPQRGGKKELQSYLLKERPYEDKNEKVFYTKGLENIQDRQGKRSDLDEIKDMIEKGMNPSEIMRQNINYRKYERIIKGAYYDKRKEETSTLRNVKVVWHTGESRTGKTYTFVNLAKTHGEESIYLMSDYSFGGLDLYMGEKILFMDEYKGGLNYQTLLDYLEGYKKQIHCRYANIYALWTEVHIASIYPPDEIYDLMTQNTNRRRDSIDQLMKRIDTIIYHYKNGEEYCQYKMPAHEYTNYDDLKQRAISDMNGFMQLNGENITPFDEKNKEQ